MNTLITITAACAGAALLAAPALAARPKPVPTGFLLKSLTRGGQEYKYAVYVPREYDGSKKWPLIMFLHGAGESGTDGLKMCIQGIGSAIQWDVAKWPFIVVFPQKPNIETQWEQHEPAVMDMLGRTRGEYNVDSDRIYLTGLSQGGHGTWIIGAHHPDIWAAIAPICGYGPGRFNQTNTNPPPAKPVYRNDAEIGADLRSTPVWAFHGEADSVVPVQETKDLVAAVEEAGGHPKMTLYPGIDHNSWDKAYREENLGTWFLSHVRTSK